MKILIPVDGSENALRAVVISSDHRSHLREPIELHLLNVQSPVASGAVKMFISQQQLNDYHRDEGLAALKEARALVDRAGLPFIITSAWGRSRPPSPATPRRRAASRS